MTNVRKLNLEEPPTQDAADQEKTLIKMEARSEEQVRRDFNDIAALMGRGLSIVEIKDWLSANRPYKLSYAAVAREVANIRRAMREAASENKRDFLIAELNRLNELEKEYWGEWQRSKNPYREDSFEETADTVEVKGRKRQDDQASDGPDIGGKNKEVVAKKSKTLHKEIERSGNLDALRGIFDIVTLRIKLLHLDSPNIWDEIDEWTEDARKEGINDPGLLFNQLVEEAVAKMKTGELPVLESK